MKKLLEQYKEDGRAYRSHAVDGVSIEQVEIDPREFLALTEQASAHAADVHPRNAADLTGAMCMLIDTMGECPYANLGAILAVAHVQIRVMKIAAHEAGALDALAKIKDMLDDCAKGGQA